MVGSRQANLRGRKRSSASPSIGNPSKSNTTTTTKSTSPYDRPFQQHLIDHGIYPALYRYPDGRGAPPPPSNVDEILQALTQPRRSLSPLRFSDDDFWKFKYANTDASKEWQITNTVIPTIEGDVPDTKCISGQIPFTNLDHLTDGTLVAGNPDQYYGARPEQLDRRVRAELNGLVIPSTQHDLPVAPNCFLAVKGPGGKTEVMERQACYDGALGARGMQSLHSYRKSEPVYDNKAYTIMFTYHSGHLKLYTSHPIRPTEDPGARTEFAMTEIDSWSLTRNSTSFREGAAAYRNAREWARLQRDNAIRQANVKAARPDIADESPLPDRLTLGLEADLSSNTRANSQDTLTAWDHDSNAAHASSDPEMSPDELSLNAPAPKRFRTVTKLRKRHTRGQQQNNSDVPQ